METGVVIIQEPVFTKPCAEEAPPGVVLDHSTMEVDKVDLSTALDDCRNSITPDVAEVLNGSGNKETEESKHEKEEAMKTISVVKDSMIVKEIANETETDEQGTTFVHEPESFNKNTNDANIILSEVNEKEDDTTQELEEVVFGKPVTEEDQTETKDSQEHEKDISKVLVPVKSSEEDIEKILDSAREEIPIKSDEEKDSRIVDNSAHETETEHNATVSVEEISRNGENIVIEKALEEEEASTDGVSLHDVETTKGVLLEAEKEAEPRLDTKQKDETETVTDPEEETTVNESVSLKENAEPVEAIKNSDDAEQVSREVTEDREKEEVQESLTVIETPTIQGEDIESKVSKDTEEHEHVLVRDIPQGETPITKDETVNTSTAQESAILKTLEMKSDEETVKTVTSSDEVQERVTVIESPKDQTSKDTEEDEHVLGRNMPQGDIFVAEGESLVIKEENKAEKSEEIPSDLALKVDEEELKVDQVVGAQTMEEQRDLELNEPEAERVDHNRTDETEEIPVAHPDVKSVEQMEKPSLESPSQVSEEKIRNLDEKIEEKPEEEVPPHQESQEEGSYGSETKEETVSVTESSEVGDKAHEERNPLQEESFQPIEQDKEMKLEKDQIHKHELSNEEVSSASPSEEREGETVVETVDTEPAKSIEDDIQESSSSTREEIQTKSKDIDNVQIDETDEEKASTTAETSDNVTKDEHNATVSVQGISRNIVPEEDRQGEHVEPVEAIKTSDGVTGDREKEEDITRKTEKVQESSTVIETQKIEEEHIESKSSKDTEEHEHVLVRDMPQVNSSTVHEAAILKTLETTSNETEDGQETKRYIEPSLDLKEETETAKTVILSDEVRPSDQVDVQAEESVEVKSKETLQEKSNEEKNHENLPDVLSVESEKFQVNEPETVLVAKTESWEKFEDIPSDLVLKVDKEELKDDKIEVNKVDGIQVMGEQSGLELNEPDAEQIDRNKIDQAEEIPVERMQSSSLECPSEVSEETSTTVDEKIEEKLQEEVTLHQEGQEKDSYGLEIKEETLSVPESTDLGGKSKEKVSCLPKETEFQQEQIEKCEPTNEVSNDQQSPVEEKYGEVVQVSSEEREGGIVVKLEDIKANEEEQVEEKIQKSLGPLDIAEPQSLLPSYSEKLQQETVSEKIEDERVKEEEPIVQILSEGDATKSHERQDEIHKTGETTAVQEDQTRDIGSSLNEKFSVDQIKAEEEANDAQEKVTSTESEDDKVDEHVHSQTSLVLSEKSDNETLTAEAKKEDEETTVRDMPPQGETIVTKAEAVDTSTVQEVAVLKTLEKKINESEAVHRPIDGEEEIPVTKEDKEPRLELKEDTEQEERETVILSNEVINDESQGREESVEVKPKEIVQHESTREKDENLLDVPYGESAEKMQMPSLESPTELSEETSKPADEKIEEKPEGEVTLLQEIQETKEETVPVPESSELGVQAKEEESCPPNEQEKETTLQKEQIEKHESTSEEDTNAQQIPVEEKSDEVIHVSSAPSPPEEHETVAEAEKIEDGKVKETEPMGDMNDKDLEISETKDLSPPFEASRLDGTESSELVGGFEEQKPKHVKEILEGDETKTDKLPSTETIPQETPSDVAAVQLKREDNAAVSHERREELSKDVEMEETMVAQEEQTRDIGTSLTEKCSMDQTQPEEQVNESRDEQENVSSTEKGETEENVDKHVDSSEKKDNETLVVETKKEDEDITVSLDGSVTSKTSENECIKQEEFENLEAPKLEESTEDKSHEVSETIEAKGDHTLAIEANQTPSFISELEYIIPKQIEDIHKEETKEAPVLVDQSLPVETSEKIQISSLVSEQEEQTSKDQEIHEEEEEYTNAHQIPVEEKSDEVIQVSSASPSGETVVEAEKIEDIKENKEEQVEYKIQRSLEAVETVEPHSSFPSPPEEHVTVAEAEKIEDGKVKETEPMVDMSDKGLEISETKDLSPPFEASGLDGTESSELVGGFEEQEPKHVKEVLEGDETKFPSSETIPQETLSDVVAVQLKREDNAAVSHERREELSKDVEMEETTVAQEEQTRDTGTSMDQTQPEEQVNESRDEQENVSSTEDGQTKTKEFEEENMDKHVDSSENNDEETLVAETKKEDEVITVSLDGSITSQTSENECIKQEEFENLKAPHIEESKEDKSQEVSETIEAKGDHTLAIEENQTPSFVSELEDKIPKQIEDIHDEETKEGRDLVDQSLPVEASQENKIPSLVSEQEDQTLKEVQEIHEEEETKESHTVEATSGRNLPVETSQAHHTPSSELVSGLDDQTPKQVEEIHEEETKAHKLQEEEIIPTEIVPRESFSETPASILASGEDDQVTVQEGNFSGDTPEEKHVLEATEESVGETKPKESEVERTEKSDDQIETLKVTKVQDEDTKETDTEVAEITKGQSLSHAPENVCLEQEELKDPGTLKPGAIIEDQDSLKNDNSDDFTFSTETSAADNGDETISTLPVVGILKELQTTLEENERAINDSEAESSGNDFHSVKEEPQPLEKNLVPDISEPVTYEKQDEKVVEESPASEIIEANMLLQRESGETETIQEELKLQEEHKEEGKVQNSITREFEVDVEERLQEETREIAECKEETPADLSLTEMVPGEKILIPSSDMPFEELKQEEGETQEDVNASAPEKISLQEEHPRDSETSKKEQNTETHETVKEEDQIVDIKEETKNEELQDEKLSGLSARRDTEETFSSEVKKDQEDASEFEVEHGSPTLQVKKEEESHSVLGNDQEINEVVTSEKKITDPIDVIKKSEEAEHASNDGHIETQAISDDSKSHNDSDFPTEQAPKDQSEDVNADESLTKEALDVQVQDQPKDFEAPVTYEDTTGKEKKSNELTSVQEDIGTNVKPEVRDGHDSVAAQNEESGLIKEKSEVAYLKTEPEDAIKHGVSIEEKNDMFEKTGQEATKEIYQEESKQTDNVTAINEVIKEEEKEKPEECFNSMKSTADATEQTKPEIQETDKLSSVSETQDKSSKQEDEVPNQQKREIADEVPKLENLKIAEELQQQDGESEGNKEPEPTVKETARKSLSDLIQKGKGTDKTEVATAKPRIEEEPKTEEEDEDGDEHKDDKTSPDSIVMVETKDTVSIIKTQKKSQGILSGVGSKVKHSISKVKKAFTGKSSHTTKPSSPQ